MTSLTSRKRYVHVLHSIMIVRTLPFTVQPFSLFFCFEFRIFLFRILLILPEKGDDKWVGEGKWEEED